MKRTLIIVLTLSILVSFVACTNETNQQKTTKTEAKATSKSTTELVDENLLTVDFTIPADFFNEESPATDKLTQEQKDSGIKSATVNKDGSVTYTISKLAYKKLIKEMKASTEEGLNDITKDYSCIKSVEFNSNFSEITLNADKSEYESDLNVFCVMQAGMLAMLYQSYSGVKEADLKSVIKVIDENGKTIDTAEYPIKD